jgi:DNA-binding CsgD family transcriptional regulator
VRSWGLSAEEQEELWRRWRRGESLRLIARRLSKRGPSVRAFVLQTGGVQRQPPRRNVRCLSMAEREEISRSVAVGESCRQIAARLGRAPSTVSRELARNSGRYRYRAQAADAAAFRRAQRPKAAKLVLEPRLRAVVEAKLALRWSPQQIAGWLPLAYPQDPVMRVSHETIYLSLFVQSRGALRRELQRCLRTGRAMRYPRAKRLPQGRGQLRDTLHISQRPAEAADRAVPDHWEGDLVFGRRPSAVGTLSNWSTSTLERVSTRNANSIVMKAAYSPRFLATSWTSCFLFLPRNNRAILASRLRRARRSSAVNWKNPRVGMEPSRSSHPRCFMRYSPFGCDRRRFRKKSIKNTPQITLS